MHRFCPILGHRLSNLYSKITISKIVVKIIFVNFSENL